MDNQTDRDFFEILIYESQMASLAIIAALDNELAPLKRDFIKTSTQPLVGSIHISEGRLPYVNKKIICCVFGVGKVLASMATQAMIERYNPEHIFLIGACGGSSKDIYAGDIIIPSHTIQSDYDLTCFGFKPGEFQGSSSDQKIDRLPTDQDIVRQGLSLNVSLIEIQGRKPCLKTGLMATQDCLETNVDRLKENEITFDYLGFEMESAAVNIVCHYNQVKFNAIKGVLDTGGIFEKDFFEKNIEKICENSYRVLAALLGKK